jgi:hypothetical protein
MMGIKHKRYSLSIICAIFCAYFFSVLWVFAGYFFPELDTRWTDGLYKKKEAYALSIKGPKIAIVAGSSGLFGVSAADIEKYFAIPTVNMSTHAGLRDYMFYRAKETLHSGDLVILALEYDHYFFDLPMTAVKADYIVNYDKNSLIKLPFKEKIAILKTYAHPWKIFKKLGLSFFVKKNAKVDSSGYRPVNLNRNGDETSNFARKKTVIKPDYFPKRFNPDNFMVPKILEFIHWCKAKDIAVVITWPGTLTPENAGTGYDTDFFDSLVAFCSGKGVDILGRPEDFFVPDAFLFDTIYHLNQEGVMKRTSKTICFLEKSPTFTKWQGQHIGRFDSIQPEADPVYTNICKNGDMELARNNTVSCWAPVVGDPHNPDGLALWDHSEAHEGQYSLKLTNTTGRQVRWEGEKVSLASGIRMIHMGGWSKCENIQEAASYCINVKTFFKDGSFHWNTRELFFSKGLHDWEQVQTVFNFDEDVTSVQPFLILYSTTGTAWFDDVFIRVQTGSKLKPKNLDTKFESTRGLN